MYLFYSINLGQSRRGLEVISFVLFYILHSVFSAKSETRGLSLDFMRNHNLLSANQFLVPATFGKMLRTENIID